MISPEATGGIGTNYEGASIAAYLSALLTKENAPGVPGVVIGVSVQQAGAGRPLDDIVIHWRDDLGRTGTLDLQLKHQLTVSVGATNSNFAAIVQDVWTTMHLPEFHKGRDLAGAACEIVATDSLYACAKLRDIACLAADGTVFVTQLDDTAGKALKSIYEAVAILLGSVLGRRATSAECFDFWRHFVLVRLETTEHRGADRLRATDRLRGLDGTANANPSQLFGLLEALAKQLNVRAAQVDRNQLIGLLKERFGTEVEPCEPSLALLLQTARSGATAELEQFCLSAQANLIEPEFVVVRSNKPDDPQPHFGLIELEACLRDMRTATVVGEPGSGKSQALHQAAVSLLAASDLIPIVRSFPALAQKQQSLLEQICNAPAFAALQPSDMVALARAGRLILLLDGWNELNAEQRDWAWTQLSDLQRDHPSAIIVVTSRSGTVAPFGNERMLEIQPFNRYRQFLAAERLAGADGHELLIRARAVPSLRPLLRTPIFLTTIIKDGVAGVLPTDREQVIARLIEQAGGSQLRRDRLRTALDGNHRAFLEAIAWALMQAGTTTLNEKAAKLTIAKLSQTLKAEGLLTKAVSPQDVLDLLIAHHFLVSQGSPDDLLIAFQHQLIQEWFASLQLEHMILTQRRGRIDSTLLVLLNAPFWSVAILLAIDRLQRQNPLPTDAMSAVIFASLGIEPFLAAEMLHRAGDWAGEFDTEIADFAQRWAASEPIRAARFMLATGRPQFATQLWQALRDRKEIVFDLRSMTHGIPISALKPGWDTEFPKLSNQARRTLLMDLVEQGAPASLDLVVRSAAKDPDAEVVSGLVDYLGFYEEHSHLERLLDQLPDAMWSKIVRGRIPDDVTPAHDKKWNRFRRARFKHATGIEWINLALEFECAPARAIVEATLDLKSDNHWSSGQLEERVFARFPDQFSEICTKRLLGGGTLPFRAEGYLTHVSRNKSNALIDLALTQDTGYGRVQLIARLLDRETIATLVRDLLSAAGDREQSRSERNRRSRDILRHVDFTLLFSEVLAQAALTAGQGVALASLLANWRESEERSKILPLTGDDRDQIIKRLGIWTQLALDDVDLPRYDIAELASLVGRIADNALLPLLLTLWNRDRSQQASQLNARNSHPHDGRHDEAHMGYDMHYRDALINIGGDGVIAAMLDQIGNEPFEHTAIIVLGQLLKVEPDAEGPFGRSGKDIAVLRAHLADRSAGAASFVAAKILDRVDALMATGKLDAMARAIQLAAPATLLNYGDRRRSFLALLEAPLSAGSRSDLCKTLIQAGEMLPAHVVRAGLAQGIADHAKLKWASDNDEWRIKEWLRLIAYADNPLEALPDFSTLPVFAARSHQLYELIFALGFSPAPNAVKALSAILTFAPLELHGATWPQALAQIGSSEAANLLLDAICSSEDDDKKWRDTYSLRNALASLISQRGADRDKAFDLLATFANRYKKLVIVDAIVQTLDEVDALKLLSVAVTTSDADIGKALAQSLENAAVLRNPVEGSSNTYELEAAPLTEFRRRVFALATDGGPNSAVAIKCLQAIDNLRDRHGKPISEPHHPDLANGNPWPIAAHEIWLASLVRSRAAT